MTHTQIARDPFARTSLVRETIKQNPPGECDECGTRRRDGLFRYGTESDGSPGRVNWHTGLFCSKSCHDGNHGL